MSFSLNELVTVVVLKDNSHLFMVDIYLNFGLNTYSVF